MTRPILIGFFTALCTGIIYFATAEYKYPEFENYEHGENEADENELEEFVANAGFDLLRTADPATGKIPSGALMKAYDDLKSRGFYQINNSELKTEDEITGWNQIDDFFPTLSVTKMAYDPTNTQIFYFCTGEGWYNVDAVKGAGIFKSTNGGDTWTHLASTDTSLFDYCQDIVVQPVTGDIFVATRTGGLQRSQDGGATWEKVLGFGMGAAKNTAADIELTADNGLFVSIGIFETDGIYYSPTGDPGSFIKQAGGLPASGYFRIEIATAPSDADVVYAIYGNNSDYKIKGIYKTINKGVNWTAVNTPENNLDFAAKQSWYDLSMGVDPNNPDVVAIGGLNIWRTRDGGEIWERMTSGGLDSVLIRYVHVDQHEVFFRNSDEVYFGNDGGIWKCDNFTAEQPFIYHRNNGYNVTQFYSVSTHPFAGVPHLMGGTQDNGTPYTYDAGIADYKFVSGADGAFTAFNYEVPDIFYTATQERRLFRFDNGGFEPPDTITNYNLTNFNVLFINPFDIDASDPEYLFQCSNKGLYRLGNASTADSLDWVKCANIGGTLTAIGSGKAAPGIVFIGRSSAAGDIFRLENAYTSDLTTVPFNADPNDMLPDAAFTGTIYCSSIVPGLNNANHVVVTYSNYGVESVWQSYNALDPNPVWENIEGDLPDIPVYWSAIHPLFENVIYIATEMGVFYSIAQAGEATNWIPCSNFPMVRTDMLKIKESEMLLIAGTHGRGIWQGNFDAGGMNNNIIFFERGPDNVGGRTRTIMVDPNDPTGETVWAGSIAGGLWKTTAIGDVPVESAGNPQFTFELFPNPATDQITIQYSGTPGEKISLTLIDMFGNQVNGMENIIISGEQLLKYRLPSTLSKGIYFLVLRSGDKKLVKKLIIS